FLGDLKERIDALTSSGEQFEDGLDKNDFRVGAGKLKAELEKLEQQAKLSCEEWKKKNGGSLKEVLELEQVQKPLRPMHKEMTEANQAFESSLGSTDYVLAAAECKNLDGILRRFVARNKFEELDDPVGEGIWQIVVTQIYTPPRPIEVP